jgi:hypothetical protein
MIVLEHFIVILLFHLLLIHLHPDSIYISVSPFEFLDLMLIGIKKNSFFVKRYADYRYVLQLIRCYL